MTAPTLLAESVSVRFGGLQAVKEISLEVGAGQILGVIGPNGAGKSTLFNAISGHQPVTEGRIHFLGREVTHLPAHVRACMGLARTFQLGGIIGDLTALENVALGLDHGVRAGRKRLRRVEVVHAALELLDRLNLASLADELALNLPAGMKRQIEVVRAIAAGAALVLLDEPGAGLTEGERAHLAETIRSLAAEGTAFMLTDHSTDLVFAVSDEVIVMNFGELIARGQAHQIKRDPIVMEAYLGTVASHDRAG